MEPFDAVYLLNKSSRLLRIRINQKLCELSLTFPQLLLLKNLSDIEQEQGTNAETTPAAIAGLMNYDRPTVTGILDRLVKQNLVSREPNPADRRSLSIRMTEKSRCLVDHMDRFFDEINQNVLENFTEHQKEQFQNCLMKVIKNLE